ncbi:Similar to RF_0381: Putative ankyrin repeat protein RF_0381 (Rickettsia felis (strain ATCC VR-1525 / URRWXCal2)) [Cotesia congregata]|uniref:Similar to RF_0381: Putative ankyrin repeat protein RF_0381 (Rickettsia felis (Strain ATCC VR-1525 / URRWXCal2)) n=1 Tax=Cotesia congregata TaxID=51543 RepID=A0A8J2MFC8_COTCN|nr:Similar to RF_0381: Putative ankyrin repeat protein RF_0381 (Rickettsia felis (strain ATCC VR-1525 / URRWXCal2)) [Cotesia congregata]
MAARFGHFEIIKFLIEQGLDVNITERKCGSSILHHAAASPNYKLVKFLLDNNAKIDAKKRNGETPILCAISNTRINIVKLLIARGADINTGQGSIKRSIILHYKLSSFDTCAKSCSIILNVSFDVKVQDSDSQFDCESIIESLIVTLTSAGLTVCEGNRQAGEKGYYDDFTKTCLEELQKMKVNKVGVSNITFFNVLHMSFHYLAIRLKFASLDQVINERKLNIAYPTYGVRLFQKLSKVQRRIKYLEEVEEFVGGMLWDLGLPSTFIRELWYYFTNVQLKKIIFHKNDDLSMLFKDFIEI